MRLTVSLCLYTASKNRAGHGLCNNPSCYMSAAVVTSIMDHASRLSVVNTILAQAARCKQISWHSHCQSNMDGPGYRPAVTWDPQVAAYLAGAFGPTAFEEISAALSRPPTCTCVRVNTCKASVQDVLKQVTQAAHQQQQAQQQGQQRIEHGVPGDPYVHPSVPIAIMLPGQGPLPVDYALAGGHEVVISRKAGEAVLRGAPVYAPGVVASTGGISAGQLVAVTVAVEAPGSKGCGITRGTVLPLKSDTREDKDTPAHVADVPSSAGPVTEHATTGSRNLEGSAAMTPAAAFGRNLEGSSSRPADVAQLPGVPASAGIDTGAAAAVNSYMESPCPQSSDAVPCAVAAAVAQAHAHANQMESTPDGTAGLQEAGCTATAATATVDMTTQAPSDATVPVAPGKGKHKRAASSNTLNGDTVIKTTGMSKRAATARAQRASKQLPSRQHLHVGLGRAMMSRAEMFRVDGGLAVAMVQPVFTLPSVSGVPEGMTMLQNLPSIVAALALSPAPGSRVLDMCAAPGGKTTLLAQIMGDQGEIIALDRTHAKAQEIMSLAAELGFTCIKAYRMDATKALLQPDASQPAGPGSETNTQTAEMDEAEDVDAALMDHIGGGTDASMGKSAAAAVSAKAAARAARKQAARAARGLDPVMVKKRVTMNREQAEPTAQEANASPADIAVEEPAEVSAATSASPQGFPAESFDAVLLDAPCSALGLRPRLLQPANLKYLMQCGLYTRKLMDVAVRLLKPGGRLVFSTCTISPRENEANVRHLLDKYEGTLQLVKAEPYVGGPGLVGQHPGLSAATQAMTKSVTCGGVSGTQGHLGKGPASLEDCLPESGKCNSTGGGSFSLTACEPESGHRVAVGVSIDNTVNASRQQLTAAHDDDPVKGEQWLTEEEACLVQRFSPAGPQDTIGFFVAAFQKLGSTEAPRQGLATQ